MDFYLQQHSEIQEWHRSFVFEISTGIIYTPPDFSEEQMKEFIKEWGKICSSIIYTPPLCNHRITTKDFDDWERQIYGYE